MSIIIASSAGPLSKITLDDLDGQAYEDTGGATATYEVAVSFAGDGFVDIPRLQSADINNVEQYCIPGALVSSLSVRFTQVSGFAFNDGDALNIWHALSTTPRAAGYSYATAGGLDLVTGVLRCELSTDGGSTIAASADVTLTAGESA